MKLHHEGQNCASLPCQNLSSREAKTARADFGLTGPLQRRVII